MEQETVAPPMKMDELVQTYVKLRTKKSQLKKQYETEAAKIDAVQDKIEALMIMRFDEMGIESVRTDEGTAYVSARNTASLADWDSFKVFCEKQEDKYMFLDRRVNKSAVEQYKSANNDLPPGVSWSSTKTINFRK